MLALIISVCIPTYNEEKFIGECLRALRDSDLSGLPYEIIVSDGGSTDATAEIVRAWSSELKITLLNTPNGTASRNLNACLAIAQGKYFCRIDARSRVSPDYFRVGLAEMRKRVDCVCGVGPSVQMIPSFNDRYCRNMAAFYSSPFLMGPSEYKRSVFFRNYSGFSGTIYLGFLLVSDVLAIGGFSESLIRRQDIDLYKRLKEYTGKKLWISSSLSASYVLKDDSAVSLIRRGFNQGYYAIGATVALRPAHVIPTIALAVFAVIMFFSPLISAVVLICYLIASGVLGALEAGDYRSLFLSMFVFSSTHLAYVVGNFWGAVHLLKKWLMGN